MRTRTTSPSRLAGVWILAECDPAELARIERLVTVVEVPSDRRVLMHQGAFGNEFLMLLAGSLEVLVDDVVVATLDAGEVVGELSLLLDAPRTATVRTRSSSELAVVPRAEFEQFLRDAPNATRRLLRTVAGRSVPIGRAASDGDASESSACHRHGR